MMSYTMACTSSCSIGGRLMRRMSPCTLIIGGSPADRCRSEALFLTAKASSSAMSIYNPRSQRRTTSSCWQGRRGRPAILDLWPTTFFNPMPASFDYEPRREGEARHSLTHRRSRQGCPPRSGLDSSYRGEQKLPGSGPSNRVCDGTARVRRELRPGGTAQDRRAVRAPGHRMATHRASPEQQGRGRGAELLVGRDHRPARDSTASLDCPRRPLAPAQRLHPGQHQWREQQAWSDSIDGAGAGARSWETPRSRAARVHGYRATADEGAQVRAQFRLL